MASLQSLTVEYVVSGSLDGTTPAPPIVVDRSADDSTPFDPETQIYRVEVENLGLIDPDLGVGGSVGPRCIPFLWIDTEELGAAGASLEVAGIVADAAKSQDVVEDLAGKPGTYADDGFFVPQGSAIRLSGFTAGAEPIIVRVSIFTPASCSDFALGVIAREAGVVPPPPAAPAGALRNVGLVNPDTGDDATGVIGTTFAFRTIQGFIDAVPQGGDSAGARNVYVAQISPADYDEDLAIDISRRRIILTGPGPWNLGTFADSDWGPSGTPRNIVVTGSDANIDGIRPGLVITNNLPLSEAMTTHESYLTRPRISGQIDLSGASGLGSVELALTCEIFAEGTGIAIEAGATIIQSYMYHCRMRGRLLGVNWQFQVAQRCRFDELIDIGNYSLFQSCRINSDLTVAGSGFAGIRPNGILLTTFAGTYTGAAGSFFCDAYSNWWQKANNPLGVTAAQKTIQGDLTP